MDCHELPELGPDFHAGTLDAPAAALYAQHLAACERCQREDGEYRDGLTLLLPMPAARPRRSDPEFLSALMAAIDRAAPARPRQPIALPAPLSRVAAGRRHALAPLALAASLLVMLSGLLWLDRPARGPDPTAALAALSGPELIDEDPMLAWAELPQLEERLLDAQEAELLDEIGDAFTGGLDPAGLEDELWLLAQDDESALDESWSAEFDPSLQDELERLEPQQLELLMEILEQG
jgi:hypothetical protein